VEYNVGVWNPPGKRIRGGNDSMTRQEIDRKKEIAAGALLVKSGVGGIHARGLLDLEYLDMIREIGIAGSLDEAIVKVALQFAFEDVDKFKEFILKETRTDWHKRKFYVRR